MRLWTYMNIRDQGHPLTLVQCHSDSTFSNFFSLETTRPVEVKFHVVPPWHGRTKVCSNGPGHMTIWPPCSYMEKTLKNLLLWNQMAYDLESWCAALSARVLPSLYKWWCWVDLDLFYVKVKFGPLCCCIGKTMDYSETIVVWYQSW